MVPFRLTNDYSSIDVLINNRPAKFSCFNNSYKANTLCSASISSLWLSGNNDQIKIIGYDNSSKIIANTILVLTNNNVGNLITSGVNQVINPNDGTNPQTIYLVNNGNNTVSRLTILPAYPISVSSNTCSSSLAANASCSFVINVSGSIASGQSSVSVSYSSGQNSKILFFNVSYINQNTASLTLTTSGNFNNLIQNSGVAYISVNVYNSGSANLTNMQFSNLNLQKNNMSSFAANSTCSNGGSLAAGQNCLISFSYFPTTIESGIVNFIPTANYAGPDGQTLSYANSILNIAYSTISSPGFVIVGDFGTVSRSSNYPPGAWAATIDSPFNTTTESANGMVINGGTYAMTMNSGRVVYSESYALFWKNAASTNLSSSRCGLIYDGTNYYTCGTSSTNWGACTTGNGCLESTTNLSNSWSSTYGLSSPINTIQYFNNGTNQAYVGSATRIPGISSSIYASTTGVNFSNIGGGLGQNTIGTLVVFNPNTGVMQNFGYNPGLGSGMQTIANVLINRLEFIKQSSQFYA